jgi:hypothetical protein
MNLRSAVPLLGLLLAVPAFPEEPPSIESMAQVKPGEKAQLDLQTIHRYGEAQGRFDVVLAWADPGMPRPEGQAMRRVRYMANCEEGTITLAAVGVFDSAGQVLKTMVAPPRSVDPVKPEKGSEEAKWLRRVCMF